MAGGSILRTRDRVSFTERPVVCTAFLRTVFATAGGRSRRATDNEAGIRTSGVLFLAFASRSRQTSRFPRDSNLPRIEMHYRLKGGGTFLPTTEFIERALTSDAGGFASSVLSRPDEVVCSCVHAANHVFIAVAGFTIRSVSRLDSQTQNAKPCASLRHVILNQAGWWLRYS